MPDRLQEALKYAAYGYHVIPFYARSKTPAFQPGEIYPYRTSGRI